MGVAPTISRLGAPNRARYSFAGIIYNASKNASDYSPGNKALKNTLTPEAQLKNVGEVRHTSSTARQGLSDLAAGISTLTDKCPTISY